jgi:hypothetical protein
LPASRQSPRETTVAVHVRFGGRWGDPLRATDEDAAALLHCAWNVTVVKARRRRQGGGHGGGKAVVLAWHVASDDQQRLLRVLQREIAPRVLGEPGLTLRVRWVAHGVESHIGKWGLAAGDTGDALPMQPRQQPQGAESAADKQRAVERLWLDFFHLANADVCVLVGSGFPLMACRMSRRIDRPLVVDRDIFIFHTGQGTKNAHVR